MSDPSLNQPYYFGAVPAVDTPSFEQQPASVEQQPTVIVAVDEPQPPIDGEVLPPVADAPAAAPQYPIGLIDFNQPIAVLDHDDYADEVYGNPSIVTILKGSMHPVVVTFWKHGEQCIEQFDTDGDSMSGDYKIEQELVYPAVRYVVIGRDGRNLVVDEELYSSEEAAREKTDLEDIAAVVMVTIEAPAPTLADDVAGAGSVHDGIDEGFGDDSDESEESEEEGGEATKPPAVEAPTEMYVAGRPRHVGETVHAYRNGFGTRVCTILKMRRDSRKSLYLDPQDGNEPYWALNKNVRY